LLENKILDFHIYFFILKTRLLFYRKPYMHADPSSHWKEFDDNKVTHSAAHYLFAIEDLHEEN